MPKVMAKSSATNKEEVLEVWYMQLQGVFGERAVMSCKILGKALPQDDWSAHRPAPRPGQGHWFRLRPVRRTSCRWRARQQVRRQSGPVRQVGGSRLAEYYSNQLGREFQAPGRFSL